VDEAHCWQLKNTRTPDQLFRMARIVS